MRGITNLIQHSGLLVGWIPGPAGQVLHILVNPLTGLGAESILLGTCWSALTVIGHCLHDYVHIVVIIWPLLGIHYQAAEHSRLLDLGTLHRFINVSFRSTACERIHRYAIALRTT